ncbi:hypothetical protein niasHT_028707 [Heterodera trifolii]|uniref:Peptidase M12A domain-containing protein n=1 Tax=Heterodera trifolii TaxID=157864 RepID=A0ABD2JIX4_9BILA
MNSFSLLTVFLSLVINCSALPIRPLSSDVGIWKKCNGKNGIIMVENGCTKLLICYQSEMAKNRKIGKRFGVGKGNIGKKKFVECAEEIGEDQWHDAEPLGNELQEALSFAAFLDDFMPFVLAFDVGTTFCTENGGTTKFCREKCLTKAPFVGTTKSHGQTTKRTRTTTTTTSIPTTTEEEQKFAFKPFSEFVSHFGTNCSKIVFPVEVAKFIVNITARPYRIACNDYEKEYEIGQLPPHYLEDSYKDFFNACMSVPTTKCAKHAELHACYKSMKPVVPSNNAIAKLCQDHLNESNVAGFAVQICIHRDEMEQKLVFETFLNLSTTDEFIKMTRSYQISIDEIIETKKTIPIFFLEFGTDHQQSAIREKANGKVISGALTENAIGIGTVLNDIKAEEINESLTKMIHLVPPVADQMVAFFQIPTPEFAKLISAQTNLKPYENDPKKVGVSDAVGQTQLARSGWALLLFRGATIQKFKMIKKNLESKSTRCDTYGKDCAVITKLLHKIEELRNCKNETIDTSAFDLPNWVDIPPPALPYISPTKTLTCYGDLYCNKEMLQEDYDRERERCGFEPENLISRRRKRQFLKGKWDSFPIMISFLEDELPDNYRAWKAAINVGADMIMQHTCVQFKIVNVEKKANYSEGILIRDSSEIGKCYSCKGHEDKCQNGGYLNPNDCTKCHCPDGYGGEYCKALEENVNCNILADESRELKSDQTVKVFNPMIGCTSAGKECRAKLCCPRALTDLDGNEYKNWIAAEKPDMDIVISAHLSPNWTVPSTVFELTKCPHAENVYAEKRNPGTGTLRCYNPTKKQYYDCSCHGDKKCLAEEKWAHDRFLCPIMQVNGIQLQKDPRYNWTRLDIDCYKAEAGTVSFWGYSKPDTKEIIRVDEIHCLTDGVLNRFKSLQVDEQPPMKLSPTSPLLANNDALSLIHVFVPFV